VRQVPTASNAPLHVSPRLGLKFRALPTHGPDGPIGAHGRPRNRKRAHRTGGWVQNDLAALPSPSYRWAGCWYKRGGCAALPVVFCLESRRGRKGEKFSRLLGDVAIRFHQSAVTENPPPLPLPRLPVRGNLGFWRGLDSLLLPRRLFVRRGFREGFCGEGFCAPRAVCYSFLWVFFLCVKIAAFRSALTKVLSLWMDSVSLGFRWVFVRF